MSDMVKDGVDCWSLGESPTMRSFFELFEHHPNAYFHAKDREHRYIYVNQLVLKDVFGILGRSGGQNGFGLPAPGLGGSLSCGGSASDG